MHNQQTEPAPTVPRPDLPLSPVRGFALRLRARVDAIPPRRLVAIALAMVVGTATYSVVGAAQSDRSQWGEVLQVVVAVGNIKPGEPLSEANTALRSIPIAIVPGGALTDRPSGRTASSAIGDGQIILSLQASTDRHGLDSATHSVTLPHPLAPPAIQVGDVVDLISVRAGTGRAQARSLVTAEVAHVDEGGITVVIDRRVTAAVFEALASGSVEFARRQAQG